jgi:hypothetical protein
MILINLLPQEHRQKLRTPIKLMVTVAGSVAVNCSLLAWLGWTSFGVAAEVRSELALLEDTAQGLSAQVSYHKDLEKESTFLQSREETLGRITASRVNWTHKVDELIDIVNEGGDGSEKYLIWFDDVTVDQKENKRANAFGQIKANGHSGSGKFALVANFLEDLEQSPLSKDFHKPSPPQGSQSSVDTELMPSEVWSFPLEMNLRSPEERRKQP